MNGQHLAGFGARRAALAVVAVLMCASTSHVAADDGYIQMAGGEVGWSDWSVVVDGVMGGLSSGNMAMVDEGTLRFNGTISLVGGGFSSIVKSFPEQLDVSTASGFLVNVSTLPEDEIPKGMQMSLDDSSFFWSHLAAFAVPPGPAGSTVEIFIPIEGFSRADWRGFPCRAGMECTLNKEEVTSMRFYVLFQDGPFDITFHSVKLVPSGTPEVSPPPPVEFPSATAAHDFLEDTTYTAGKLLDYTYVQIVRAMYTAALQTISSSESIANGPRDLACAGLQQSDGIESHDDAVAIMRYAIDAAAATLVGDELPLESDYPQAAQGGWLMSGACSSRR